MEKLTNTQYNSDLAEKFIASGIHTTHILTYDPTSGWIHDGSMDAQGYVDNDSKLLNADQYMKHMKMVAAGKDGLKENNVMSQAYQTMVEEAKAQKDKIDSNPGLNPARLIGAAATGSNLIETAYEIVRRVNYLSGIVGKQYNLADYNAVDAFNIRPVNVLNVVGFRKSSALLQGLPEIGDHTTPPPARQTFATYEKSIFADSFRWEFGMRELKDSVFNLKGELTKEIPGVFARMKDDKAVVILNAAADDGAIAPNWDLITAGNFVYDTDAISDVEADEAALDQFDGSRAMVTPRAVIRAYERNIHQVGIGGSENVGSLNPTGPRKGTLAGNREVGYSINQGLTAATYIITAKQSYADLLKGAVVNVSYKNQMSPAQTEGRLTFDFNGLIVKDIAAIRRHTSVI